METSYIDFLLEESSNTLLIGNYLRLIITIAIVTAIIFLIEKYKNNKK